MDRHIPVKAISMPVNDATNDDNDTDRHPSRLPARGVAWILLRHLTNAGLRTALGECTQDGHTYAAIYANASFEQNL
ncbi:hypothetical protein [Zwartia sp.]|uniref:hypothetical protein n=1 Tax=Zwartia sp. TaxID=2978004 RepID=UPI00271FB04C|nr:hypothetical protein [Zwartia sp.]MDO9025428.1 hypothetical protein [Zwartia sp.]